MAGADYQYCAGILPYCFFNQSLYFLLGKSKRTGRLVTFSGKNEAREDDPCVTACREGYEETLGIIEHALLLKKVRSCTPQQTLRSQTPRGKPCYTYIIEIPYKKYYTSSFQITRDLLRSMNINVASLNEMSDIKWVCANTMFTKIRASWQMNGMLKSHDEWSKLTGLQKLHGPWRRADDARADAPPAAADAPPAAADDVDAERRAPA